MAVELPEAVQAALIRSGIVAESEVKVRTVTVPGPAPVAYDATVKASPSFVPPPWYPRLRFAMLAPSQRGAALFGPRGSGKTTCVHELAKAESVNLITYQAAAGCTIDDLVGVRDLTSGLPELPQLTKGLPQDFIDNYKKAMASCTGPRTVFTPGPLPDALMADTWLLIEEANVMHPAVFSKLNTLTDGSGDTLRLPDGSRLAVGPKFRVVLAFNEGAAYSGTREVNAALRDRLMPIYADYLPEKSEVAIITQRTGCDDQTARKLVGFANQVRAARDKLGFDLSPRALFRVLDLIRFCGDNWSGAFEHGILDLVGDPQAKRQERDAISQIADANGLRAWSAPRFTVAPAAPKIIVASDATGGAA